MKISFTVEGEKEFKENLKHAKTSYVKALWQAIKEEAHEIYEESLNEVPVGETGALKASAFLKEENADVILGYGGENDQINSKSGKSTKTYMVAVHERLDIHHAVGKAKFLEDPVNRHTAKFEDSIADKIKKYLNL